MLFDPPFNRSNIAAFVPCVEISERIWRLLDPVVRYDSNICIAHDVLTEHLNAMFYQKVVSYPRDLMGHRMDLMYQSATLSSMVGHGRWRACELLACSSPGGHPCEED